MIVDVGAAGAELQRELEFLLGRGPVEVLRELDERRHGVRVAETVVDGERPGHRGPRAFDRLGLVHDPPLIAISA